MALADIPRIGLGSLPTPLDEAPRLGAELGLRRLLIKRDDMTGLGLGGNKVRKLEFLMADALRQKCDVVMTDGGPQSNHARLTAAAARVVGMESVIFLGGERSKRYAGNMLLDVIFGADIQFMPDATVKQMEAAMARTAEAYKWAGRKPYVIPIGGSNPIGALGYVEAMRELAEQLGEDDDPQIFFAVGSAGTLAGVTAGCRLFLPKAKVIGISVARKQKPLQKIAKSVAEGALELVGEKQEIDLDSIYINDNYVGGRYGVPSEAGIEAIMLAGQTEAMVLDPVYTGKAMAGLIDLARKGRIDSSRTTIFIHTGGAPGLFAFEEEFRKFAKYSEIR